jgi:hypothetical protein
VSLIVCFFVKKMNNINYSIQNTFSNKMITNSSKYYLWPWKIACAIVVGSQSHHINIYINVLILLPYYSEIAFAKQMYIQNVIKYWHWDTCWFEFIKKEYKCGLHGSCAYNQVIGFRIKFSFHPNAWYSHWQSNLSKGLVSYPFYEAIIASNEKPLIPFCTYVVGSELGDVRHSKLPPLCQEGPLNTLLMKLETFQWKWSLNP